MIRPISAGDADQATRLRELTRGRSRSAITIAVTSGKGGVGKSNVAVNLSICLAANSLRVTLVDVDMGLANADLLLNLQPRYTLSHVLTGVRTLDEIAMEGPGGLRFIPGASGIPECANLSDFERQTLISQLHKLETSADMVVLDCGAGISRNVLGFATEADHVLVVTTPQPTALTDAYALIKCLHRGQSRAKVWLLVNQAHSRGEAESVFERVSGVARRFLNFPVADLGYMLHDTAVESAVRERTPFAIRYPGSNATACIASMAGRLTRSFAGQENRGGFFRRVAGLFV